MAAVTTLPYTPPVQALPSWLSYSTYITTFGSPATAVITQKVVNLPLTYYGPPIPLGDDGVWVYGGLTSPTGTTSTHAPSSTATSSPTTTSASKPTTSAPSSGATATTPQPTATDTSGTTPTASPSGGSNINDRVLLIIVLVITLFFFFVLAVAILAWLRRRRQARVVAAQPDDNSGFQHRGAVFSRVRPGNFFGSFYRGNSHRHSRLPTDEEAVPGRRHHPNESDWDFVTPSDRGTSPSVRMVTSTGDAPTGPVGAGVRYRSLLPFDESMHDEGNVSSHAPSSSSSQNRFPRPHTDMTAGRSLDDTSTARSLFFINPTLQAGESLSRDPRIFPDSYAYGENRGHGSSTRIESLLPPPRNFSSGGRSMPPPVDEEILLPPPLIGHRPGTPPRPSASTPRAAPVMAYPDSPVSDPDEGATLLRRDTSRFTRPPSPIIMRSEAPGTGTEAGGLISRLSLMLKKRFSGAPEPEVTTPYMVADPSTSAPPQMKERENKMLGFGFLNAPPPPSAFGTRHTGTTGSTADRPTSTVSGRSRVSTVYHDAPSRPESPTLPLSPYADHPTDYDFSGDEDVPDFDVLDEPAPRSLRFPPGLTPTNARFLTSPDSPQDIDVEHLDLDLDDIEEEDIVPDAVPAIPIPIVQRSADILEDDPPQATAGWSKLHKPSSSSFHAHTSRRATLGEDVPMPVPVSSFSKHATDSRYGSLGSANTRGSNSNSSSSGSRNSRRTSGSLSSAELRRILAATEGEMEDPFVLDDDEMPVSGSGRRLRGGNTNPLLSATFGHGSHSASGSSRSRGNQTSASGRSIKSKARSTSGSGIGSRQGSHSHQYSHSGHGSRGSHSRSFGSRGGSPSPPHSPQGRELRLAPSFVESGSAMSSIGFHSRHATSHSASSLGVPSLTTAATDPGHSIRYVPTGTYLMEESGESDHESLPLMISNNEEGGVSTIVVGGMSSTIIPTHGPSTTIMVDSSQYRPPSQA